MEYDPLDREYKSVTGAVRAGETVRFFVRSAAPPVRLEIAEDGGEPRLYEMTPCGDGFAAEIAPTEAGLYFYRFLAPEGAYGEGEDGRAALHAAGFVLLVTRADFRVPDWLCGGVIYQIFPDRFRRSKKLSEAEFSARKPDAVYHADWSDDPVFLPDGDGKIRNNDFFGGDLAGIEEALGYLAGLGVTALYLNPVFESASNHRYDTADYEKIDPLLGSEADFTRLCAAARERGISVILDGVFNHTGADSRYFDRYGRYPDRGAYAHPDSPYRGWYRFRADGTYDSWWGVDTLPAVNEDDPSYREYIAGENGIARKWLRAGARGWRIDVADELPDDFIRLLRRAVKSEGEDKLLLGEVWEDASTKVAYDVRRAYFQGDELDSVMNYPVRDGILTFLTTNDERPFVRAVRRAVDRYPADVLASVMNHIGTHDTPRALTVLGGGFRAGEELSDAAKRRLGGRERAEAEEKLRAAAVLQYFLPGVPSVYYGDELGVEGGSDPLNRRTFPWNRLQGGLLDFYRRLGAIRKKLRGVLARGGFRFLFAERGAVAFERRSEAGVVTVAVNRSGRPLRVSFDGDATELLTGRRVTGKTTIPDGGYAAFYR